MTTWMSNLWLSPEDADHAFDEVYPHASHFLYPMVFSVFVTFLRLLIERLVLLIFFI